MADPVGNVDYLPIWKKNSTPEEWLHEVAAIARKHPHRFGRIAVVYEETLENGNTKYEYQCRNTSTTELVGLLEIGKQKVLDFTTK